MHDEGNGSASGEQESQGYDGNLIVMQSCVGLDSTHFTGYTKLKDYWCAGGLFIDWLLRCLILWYRAGKFGPGLICTGGDCKW